MTKVFMTVNGKSVSGEVEGRTLLSSFLREGLGLTGTHDVTLTYDDLSVQTLNGVAIIPGWWPAMSRPWLRSMQVA